jgi:hypothetical protein
VFGTRLAAVFGFQPFVLSPDIHAEVSVDVPSKALESTIRDNGGFFQVISKAL